MKVNKGVVPQLNKVLFNELTAMVTSGLSTARVVLPLFAENTLIGTIAIGPKLSGDPFYREDLNLLMTLANQAGVALKNAQRYSEIVVAHEYVARIVASISSGVVAVSATRRSSDCRRSRGVGPRRPSAATCLRAEASTREERGSRRTTRASP